MPTPLPSFLFFFFNDTATTEIYTLSLHDALPISAKRCGLAARCCCRDNVAGRPGRLRKSTGGGSSRSEEHTSELQSRLHLVCRLFLVKKKKNKVRVVLSVVNRQELRDQLGEPTRS